MQRLLGLAREVAVHLDEVLRLGNFAGNDDLVVAQAALEREFGRFDRGLHHAVVDDLFGVEAQFAVGILLHPAHHQLLIERAAIDADAHRLSIVHGDLADGGKLLVAPRARAHVAGIDAVLVERPRAIGIFRQQDVPVVVKIADDRRRASQIAQPRHNFRDSRRRFRHVHRDAHQLRARVGQLLALRHGPGNVRRIRVGHRLDDHRRAAADLVLADLDAIRLPPRYGENLHVFVCKLMVAQASACGFWSWHATKPHRLKPVLLRRWPLDFRASRACPQPRAWRRCRRRCVPRWGRPILPRLCARRRDSRRARRLCP